MAFPRWLSVILAVCAIVAALSLVVIARRQVPGRWVRMDNQSILDTETGRICGVSDKGPTCFNVTTIPDQSVQSH